MNHHFAELGDVWKHLPLAEVLRVNPPRLYWETHAGSASYRLTESPSRLHGALRFLALAPDDPALEGCAYLKALMDMPGLYPGSATLAMRALGTSATYVLCDVDPERSGAWGWGVVLANATEEEVRACERLGRGLERVSETDVVEGNDPSRLSFAVMA